MSEMLSRVSIAADAYMQLLHELRAYREAQQSPHQLPTSRMRLGVITARDPASLTVTIRLGASDQSDFPPDTDIPGVKLADTVYPKVGAACWVMMHGSDPCVLYTVGSTVGAARVFKNGAGSTADATLAAVNFGTVIEDTDGLFNASLGERLTPSWPGRYDVGTNIQWNFGTVAGWRETGLWKVNASAAIPIRRVKEHQSHSAIVQGQPITDQYVFGPGDWLETRVIQNSGTALGITTSGPTDQDFSTMWMVWRGP